MRPTASIDGLAVGREIGAHLGDHTVAHTDVGRVASAPVPSTTVPPRMRMSSIRAR